MNRKTLLMMGLVVLAGAACDPGFDSQYDIQDLRVLGVQAMPPEYLVPIPADAFENLDPENPPQLGGEDGEFSLPVTLKLLVADAEPDLVVYQYSVTACVLDAQLNCDLTLPNAEVAKGESTTPETQFSLEIPADVVMASFEADPAFGLLGAVVWLRGTVIGPERSEEFLKAVVITPDFYEDRKANGNPRIEGLMHGEKEDESPVDQATDGPMAVEKGEEYRFRPVIPEEDRETFQVVPFDTSLEALRSGEGMEVNFDEVEFLDVTEQLTVRYYANCGEFDSEENSEKLNPLFETEEDKKDKDLAVSWTAADEVGECRLWFIVFDNRGGVGWYAMDVRVE